MATRPFFLQLTKVLTANASGTPSFLAPPDETYTFNQIRLISTGAFDITDIKDSAGKHYTNASVSEPIKSTHFQSGASPNIGFQELAADLVLKGNLALYFDLKDTSGAGNTIIIVLNGMVETVN